MRRSWLIWLSVVDCAFGAIYLVGPHGLRSPFHAVNLVLALALAVLTADYLGRRGHRWPWVVGLLYPLAPLVGLVAFAAVSARNLDQPHEAGLAG
jgi:hypothetical protein